jgi:aromatic ring-opening dioxygenase catalytic subunit (LigB family)
MAQIIAGVGISHSPSLLSAYDPEQAFYRSLEQTKLWLGELQADAVVVIGSDHLNSLHFDWTPTFVLGVAEHYVAAQENDSTERQHLLRAKAAQGHAELGWLMAQGLISAGFDLTVAQNLTLDHGLLNPLPFLWQDTAVPIVPILVNAFQPPLPTPRRCWELGRNIAQVISALPQSWRVVVVGTGGLSHHLLGPDVGFTNAEWDHRYMELLQSHPQRLAEMSTLQLIERGGQASTENNNWLAMRGALADQAHTVRTAYHRPSFTGLGLIVLDNRDAVPAQPHT